VRAIGDRVIIRKIPPADRSRGGIFIPPPSPWLGKQEREDIDAPRATVVSIGPRAQAVGLRVGDVVRWDPKGDGKPHDWLPVEDGYLTVAVDCCLAIET
jgi:co-chaperonin GroES (HSP10)